MSSGEERLQDLLVKRTLEGTDVDEAREMATLSQLYPDVDTNQFDDTVSLLDAVPFGDAPPMPPEIAHNVMARIAPTAAEPAAGQPTSPWPWLAVAATALIAFAGWWQALTAPAASQERTRAPVQAEASPAAISSVPPVNEFEQVDGASDTISVAWSESGDSARASVRGLVRWSAAGQLGYMELAGLPLNDPDIEQYQLWIFDATRPDAFPVDGGVFDISVDGPSLVPIRAKLPVRDATLFAVTVEVAGGVVVSGRERVVALAQVP